MGEGQVDRRYLVKTQDRIVIRHPFVRRKMGGAAACSFAGQTVAKHDAYIHYIGTKK